MLVALIFGIIAGTIAVAITQIGLLFWVVGGFVFICTLPIALITGFFEDHAEDRRIEQELDSLNRWD